MRGRVRARVSRVRPRRLHQLRQETRGHNVRTSPHVYESTRSPSVSTLLQILQQHPSHSVSYDRRIQWKDVRLPFPGAMLEAMNWVWICRASGVSAAWGSRGDRPKVRRSVTVRGSACAGREREEQGGRGCVVVAGRWETARTYAARMSSRHQTVGALFTNAAPGLYTPARYDARNLVTLCERAPALVRIKGAWPAILLAMLKKADDSSYDVQATVIKRSYTFGSQRCAPMLQTLRYCNYISHIAHSRRRDIERCIPQGRPYRRI